MGKIVANMAKRGPKARKTYSFWSKKAKKMVKNDQKVVKNDEKRPKMGQKSPKTANLMPGRALGGAYAHPQSCAWHPRSAYKGGACAAGPEIALNM